MKHKKHVICEKPIASNIDEATKMFEVAKENNVVLFEAYKSQYLPNFQAIKQALNKIGKIHKAHISYCQYSSRYQRYLDGENPNTFNPTFSNGSLIDIGFYSVAAAVALFGKPQSVQASAHLLESGVDAHGSAIFSYPEFDVTLAHSKVSDSYAYSEIQGELGSILIDHIAECTDVKIQYRNGEVEDLNQPQHDNSMCYEANRFAQVLNGDKEAQSEAQQRALIVSELITEMRRQVGVHYPADEIWAQFANPMICINELLIDKLYLSWRQITWLVDIWIIWLNPPSKSKVNFNLLKVFKMFSIEDRVVATKGIELGEMVVTGLSAGGFYVHVTTIEGGFTLTYPMQDLKKA